MNTKLNINAIEDGSIIKSKLSEDVTASLDKVSDVDNKLSKSGGTMTGTITSQNIIPEKNETYSLGSNSYKYSNVYATTFNGNATKATTATQLGTSTVGSSTQPIYLSAGSPVKISSIPEDMISRVASTSGSLSIIDAAGDGIFASNRLAFKNPNEITIEYSNDGGETWFDYEASDESKTRMCTIKGGGVHLGKRHSSGIPITEENPITQNDMLRITISGNDRYFTVRKFLIYLSTSSHGNTYKLYVDVERSTWKEPDNWIEVRKDVQVSGWSGWNSIYVSPNSSYAWGSSNQQNNTGKFRFTFKYGEGSSTGGASLISNIFAIGEIMFNAPTHSIYSAMADTSHLYSYDINMNAQFPGDIKPHINKSKNLGSSTLMWNNVYSNKYYEDGVDISTKYALKSDLVSNVSLTDNRYNFVKYTSEMSVIELTNGTYYKWISVPSELILTAPSPIDDSYNSDIKIALVIGDSIPSLTINNVQWINGVEPTLEANTTLEISIFDNRATYAVFK